MAKRPPAQRVDPMFEDEIRAAPPAPIPLLSPPPRGFGPAADLGDPASVGFRLLCLDRAVDSTPPETPHQDVIRAAESVRLYLLGKHPVQIAYAAAEADAADAPTRH